MRRLGAKKYSPPSIRTKFIIANSRTSRPSRGPNGHCCGRTASASGGCPITASSPVKPAGWVK